MSRWRELISARTLSTYALREHFGPFAFALTVFTFIMLMNQVARQFQNLAGKGLGADIIVQVFLLSIPLSVAITIPMAVLVATMAAFGRLAGDNEITAIQANGVGFHQLLAPTLGAAVALTLFTFWFNDNVLPESNHRLSQLMMEIQRAKPASAKGRYLRKITLSTTMGPGVTVDGAGTSLSTCCQATSTGSA